MDCRAQQVSPEPPDGVFSDYLHCKNLPLAQARIVAGHRGTRTLLLYGFVADATQKRAAEQALLDFVGDPGVRLVDDLRIRPEIDQMNTDDEPVPAAIEPAADTGGASVPALATDPNAVDEIPGEQFAPPPAAPTSAPLQTAAQNAPPVQANEPLGGAAPQLSQAPLAYAPDYRAYGVGPRAPWVAGPMINYGNTLGFYGGMPMGFVPPQVMAGIPPVTLFMPSAMVGVVTPGLLRIQPQNAWPRAAASPFQSHLYPLGTTR